MLFWRSTRFVAFDCVFAFWVLYWIDAGICLIVLLDICSCGFLLHVVLVVCYCIFVVMFCLIFVLVVVFGFWRLVFGFGVFWVCWWWVGFGAVPSCFLVWVACCICCCCFVVCAVACCLGCDFLLSFGFSVVALRICGWFSFAMVHSGWGFGCVGCLWCLGV